MIETNELNAASTVWPFQRYYAPVSNAVRRIFSRPLSFRQVIAAVDLPAPLAEAAMEVVRRSRLWRRERLDVARELCVHFQDGLSAGRSVAELLADFGSPRLAAKLIHHAKLRNRPLWWQLYYYTSRAALLASVMIALTYATLMARFYLSQPSIRHDYWTDINTARHSPENERAWPLYREAIIKLGGYRSYFHDWVMAGPQGKHWGAVLDRVEQNSDVLELIRQGARRPRLGLYVGDPADNRALSTPGVNWCVNTEASVADDNGALAKSSSDAVLVISELAYLVAADAQRAAIEGNGATCLSDLSTLISLAEQLGQSHSAWSWYEQIEAYRTFRFTMHLVNDLLAESPAIFSDEQLVALSDRIGSFAKDLGPVDVSAHQLVFEDTLQRAFTDDGRGSGRITPNGLRLLYDLANRGPITPGQEPSLQDEVALYALGTGAAQVVETRQANRDLFEAQLRAWTSLLQGFPWEWDREAMNQLANSELNQNTASGMQKLRFLPVALLFPPIYGIAHEREVARQERDATQVAVALVRWHRLHATWPQRLEQLVPELLPAVPPDRFDGQPLRYTLRDGQPVIYSIGADRVDGGGASPEHLDMVNEGFGRISPTTLKAIQADQQRAGDWILWPPLPPKQ